MERQMFQNLQSMSGISGIGFGELDISMCNNNDSKDNEYNIKVFNPQGQFTPAFSNTEKLLQAESRKISTNNHYNTSTTGYDINRDLFSDDDIREAFQVIDINNDGCLTSQQLSFFLKCIDQPHTSEEVEEMIRMVSNDGKKVVLDDFRKIGRGKLPPFAGIHQPESQSKVKQEVLQNLQSSNISSLDPEEFYELKEDLGLSRAKFQEQKTRRQQNRESKHEDVTEEKGGMKQRTSEELKLKKEQYRRVLMFNVDKAIQVLKTVKVEVLSLEELSDVLAISEGQTRMLFQKPRLTVRQVINDIILFSQVSNLQKLQLMLKNAGRKQTMIFEDWVLLLCFMMGSDQREFIRRRLQNILKYRKISLQAKFDKYFILEVMTKEERIFVW